MKEAWMESVKTFMEEEIPFNVYLGMEVLELGSGTCRVRIPWREELVGDAKRGAIHGGVLSALADTTGGAACLTLLESREDRLSTVDLRVDYLRRAPKAELWCEAKVVRMGNRVAVARMEVFSAGEESGEPVATGQGVYNIAKSR